MENNQNMNMQPNGVDEEAGFTFKMLGSLIKRVFPMVVIWVLCAVFVSLAVGFSLNLAFNRDKEINAIVKFNFDGIDDGLDPVGNKFDANVMKSSVNISETLIKMGLYDEYINTNIISDNITIAGMVPQGVAEQLKLLQQLDTKDPDILLAISKIKYNSNRFVISFDYSMVSPTMTSTVAMAFVNNLVDQYMLYFENKYAKAEVFSTDLYKSDILVSNDYIEAFDIYKGEFDIILSYLNEIKSKAVDFRSDVTNLAIPDLISRLNKMFISLNNYESFVTTNGITRDPETTVAYLKNTLQRYTNKIEAAQAEIDELNKQLEAYKMPDIIIKGDGSTSDQIIGTITKAYDNMQNQVAGLISSKKTYSEEMSNIKDRIKAYEDSSGTATKPDMDRKMAEAQQKLTAINASMVELTGFINETILDYNKKEVIYDAMRLEGVPALANKLVLPINWILVLGIGGILGVLGGIICGQSVYVYNKKKKAQKALAA